MGKPAGEKQRGLWELCCGLFLWAGSTGSGTVDSEESEAARIPLTCRFLGLGSSPLRVWRASVDGSPPYQLCWPDLASCVLRGPAPQGGSLWQLFRFFHRPWGKLGFAKARELTLGYAELLGRTRGSAYSIAHKMHPTWSVLSETRFLPEPPEKVGVCQRCLIGTSTEPDCLIREPGAGVRAREMVSR